MKESEKNELVALVKNNLGKAEKHWENGGSELAKAMQRELAEDVMDFSGVTTPFPGHPRVSPDETIIDEFIALAVDMRDSTEHLLCEISKENADVSTLQRVFYEISALLPACGKVVQNNDGRVTEYLGDGVLCFFKVSEDSRSDVVRTVYGVACDIVTHVRDIVNSELNCRYRLPEISVGVGIAYSKAMITILGTAEYSQPKAFGECVFRATKMANDKVNRNRVFVDDKLNSIWPTSKEGKLKFKDRDFGRFKGYDVRRENT